MDWIYIGLLWSAEHSKHFNTCHIHLFTLTLTTWGQRLPCKVPTCSSEVMHPTIFPRSANPTTTRANIKSTLGFIILPKGTSTFSQSQGSDCRAPDLWMARSASSQSQQPQIRTSISWDSCAQEYAVQTTMARFKEMSAEYKDGLQCLNLNNSKWKMLQVLFFIWKTYSIQLKLQ